MICWGKQVGLAGITWDTCVHALMCCEVQAALTHTAKPWGLTRTTQGLTLTPMGRIWAPLGATLMT